MHDLTTGSVTRHLLKTTSFMLVTMLFQTLYFLVDLYWVGRLGKEAVAGVSVAGNLMFIVLAASQMLGVGATVLISHAAGRKDHDRARLLFNQAQALSMLVAAGFLAASFVIRAPYANALAADATTASLAKAYLAWFLPAMALQFGIVAMGAALRGIGDFKPGMIVQTSTVILNMVLAPFLIFGWVTHRPMGVAGAALASLIAVVVGTFWLLTYFLKPAAFLRFSPADWKPRPDLWAAMLKVGLPAGAEFALMAVYLFIIYVLARPFGAAAQAGFGIGMRILQAGFMPVVALGFAVGPVAGQNFGAHLRGRVIETFRSAVVMAASAMVVFAVLCHLVPGALVRFFSADPQVVAVGDEYLRIISWNFVSSGLIFVASSMFQALGNTMPSLIASLVRIFVLAIPAAIVARLPGFQLRWLWYLSVASVTFQLVMSLLLLRREFGRRLPAGASAPRATTVPAPVPTTGD
jgi:MATE family, multidrug efflux pump